jgi:uncharacterized protein RhaS with RHS repeats
VTTFNYDALNRPIESIDPLGNSSLMEYDPVGNLVLVTDRVGRVRQMEYDGLSRLN